MNPRSIQLTDGYGQRMNISDANAQIGSGTGRTIVLDAPDVLDLHAELRFENSEWVLWDLSDGRDISVNGVPVQTSQPLMDGDVITIGGGVLRVALQQREVEDLSFFRSDGLIESRPSETTATSDKRGMKRCSTCGRQIHEEAEICPHCGVRQKPVAELAVGTRSRTTAAILAIVLGSFGAHKFYLGQKGLGVAYLLFFWTYIPGIAGVVEGIQYLMMSDQQFAAKYG